MELSCFVFCFSTLLLLACSLDLAVAKHYGDDLIRNLIIDSVLDSADDFNQRPNSNRKSIRFDHEKRVYNDASNVEGNALISNEDLAEYDLTDHNVYNTNEIDKRMNHGGVKQNQIYPVNDERNSVDRYGNCPHRNSWYKFTDADIGELLSVMQRIHQFYADNYAKHSLDGTFGLRVAEADLQYVLERLPPGDRYHHPVKNLFEKTHETGEKIVANLKKPGHLYSQTFMELIERPLRHRRPYLNFDQRYVMMRNPALCKEDLSEKESDECLSQILGTGKHAGAGCMLDEKCLRLETSLGTDKYTLTHQPLIFLAGEHHGCQEEIVRMLGGKERTDEMYKKWANTVHSQWLEALVDGDIPKASGLEDLWYEQGLVAMMLGLVETSRVDLLRRSFLRLRREGCIYDVDFNGDVDKRSTVQIGPCDSHMTSVYLGFLSSHLRFIFTPPACEMLL